MNKVAFKNCILVDIEKNKCVPNQSIIINRETIEYIGNSNDIQKLMDLN